MKKPKTNSSHYSGQSGRSARGGLRSGRAILVGPQIHSSNEFWKTLAREGVWRSAIVRGGVHLLVGVDRGAAVLRTAGVEDFIAIGDWDGLGEKNLGSVVQDNLYITLPVRKDRSDYYYALKWVESLGYPEVLAIGFGGGDPHQELAVWLDSSVQNEMQIEIANEKNKIYFICGKMNLQKRLRVGKRRAFSVFSLGGTARGVSIRGGEYTMNQESLEPGSRGLSNRAVRESIEVSLEKGRLMVLVLL